MSDKFSELTSQTEDFSDLETEALKEMKDDIFLLVKKYQLLISQEAFCAWLLLMGVEISIIGSEIVLTKELLKKGRKWALNIVDAAFDKIHEGLDI